MIVNYETLKNNSNMLLNGNKTNLKLAIKSVEGVSNAVKAKLEDNLSLSYLLWNDKVLQHNKYNMVFFYHLRCVELSIYEKTLLKALKPLLNNGAFDINVFTNYYNNNVKIISNVNLDFQLQRLKDAERLQKKEVFFKGKKHFIYTYNIKFNI